MKSSNQPLTSRLSTIGALFSNGIVFLACGVAIYLFNYAYGSYYFYVQEDGWLEWTSFWAFFVAAVFFGIRAKHLFRANGFVASWFVAGLSLFCFIVAMEEISWGQRLFGYLPPEYFLENNYQQEFNFHNVVAVDYRILALKVIILGYGVLLPLMNQVKIIRSLLTKWNIAVSPLQLIPAFLAAFLLYQSYAIKFAGEVVELMTGLGFLYAAIALISPVPENSFLHPQKRLTVLLLSTAIISILGLLNAYASDVFRNDDPKIVAAARKESEALFTGYYNLLAGKYNQKSPICNFHRRVFTQKSQYDGLAEEALSLFKSLQSQGLPEERATFIIDPWNSPYWIRDYCLDDGRRLIQVYSLGPDRQRQSTRAAIGGDDVGGMNIFEF